MADLASLPGGELVAQGLRDLAAGRESIAALLVAIGAPRLAPLGLKVPAERIPPDPERRLYQRLAVEEPQGAHGRYNSLLRRLVSFERALEAQRGRSSTG